MAGALDDKTGVLYPVARALMSPVFGFSWRFEVNGAENLPADGPAIIAANHTSVIDSFFVPAVLPRKITYVGKAEYLDDWKTKHLFPALGMIPIDRSGGSAAQAALDAAACVLEGGEFFGIYPEGTRSRSGQLHKGRTGATRLAMRTGAPIVPVGLRGTREVQPPDAPYPKPFMTIEINFGEPVDVAAHAERKEDPRLYRELTDELMFRISRLSGQNYIDTYANAPAPSEEMKEPVPDTPMEPRRSSADVLAMASA